MADREFYTEAERERGAIEKRTAKDPIPSTEAVLHVSCAR